MDAGSFGLTVFNALPSWLKGTATFTRVTNTYDFVSGAQTPTTKTASAPCVTQPARGTQSESFVNLTEIREKYLTVTVPAVPLKGFVPQSGDLVKVGGTTFRVNGVETIQPDGSKPVVYLCTVSL